MPMKKIDRIMSAKERGGGKKYIESLVGIFRKNGTPISMSGLDAPSGPQVNARIEHGRWLADCECGGAEVIDPEEPIFFCFSCGNVANNGACRPVVIPPEWRAIEQVLLLRPINDATSGLNDEQRMMNSRPAIWVELPFEDVDENGQPRQSTKLMPLTRSWLPGETIQDLHNQQDEPIRKWKEENGL